MPVPSHKYLMALSSCFSISEEQKLFVLTSDISFHQCLQSGVTHLFFSFYYLNEAALDKHFLHGGSDSESNCEFIAKPDKLCRNVPEVTLTDMDCSGRRRAQESAEVSW